MAFPNNPAPQSGNVYVHEDRDNGKLWSYDNNVWTPREISALNDLSNVVNVSKYTTDTSGTVHTTNAVGSTVVDMNTGTEFVRLEFEAGYDFILESIDLSFLRRDAATTTSLTVTLQIWQGTHPPDFNNTALDSADILSFISSTGIDSPYTSTVSGADIPTTNSTITFSFTEGEIIKRGRFTGLLYVTGPDGPIEYIGDFETGYVIKGKKCSSPPVDGSFLTYNGTLWEADGKDPAVQYNLITRQTTDPTPADLSNWQLGTFWVNTTTGTLFVHTGTGVSTQPGEWRKYSYADVSYVTNAKAFISPVQPDSAGVDIGMMWIDNSAAPTLKLWNGTTWTTLV